MEAPGVAGKPGCGGRGGVGGEVTALGLRCLSKYTGDVTALMGDGPVGLGRQWHGSQFPVSSISFTSWPGFHHLESEEGHSIYLGG